MFLFGDEGHEIKGRVRVPGPAPPRYKTPLLLIHLLAAALEWNRTLVWREWVTRTRFFNTQLKTTFLTIKNISLFHVATICHFDSPFNESMYDPGYSETK